MLRRNNNSRCVVVCYTGALCFCFKSSLFKPRNPSRFPRHPASDPGLRKRACFRRKHVLDLLTCHERGPRCGAVRHLRLRVGEPGAFGQKAINVGSVNGAAAKGCGALLATLLERRVAQVINNEHEEIFAQDGAALGTWCGCRTHGLGINTCGHGCKKEQQYARRGPRRPRLARHGHEQRVWPYSTWPSSHLKAHTWAARGS